MTTQRRLIATDMRKSRRGTRWRVALEYKPADLWIGGYYSTTLGPTSKWAVLDVWICLVPCLPIHIFMNRAPVGMR